ncbi:hypothetical protein EX30DRAFT_343349 [Ascodesmis nigricans]|uniref:CNH-domain-containing protein n=1 Tax=Ascodesmis nigricans TaxID=341454 RepID=A0A4V3SI07_9PEZI|nr:hypothetical protein EX30DRAFT_343349 [Ascodesmis nigricans]
MADPYQNRGAYSNNYNQQPQYSQQQQQQYSSYPSNDPRRTGYEEDDLAYYESASNASQRQSLPLSNDQFYDSYYTSPPPPPPPPRRGSMTTIPIRELQYGQGPNGTYATQQQQQQQPPYSPGYPSGYDQRGDGHNNAPQTPGHAPYNPASYAAPTRHPTTAGNSGMYVPPEQRPQRHASSAAPFSPTSYNPNAYGNHTPYPSAGGYPGGRQPLQMPTGQTSPQHQQQQPYSPGFAPSGYGQMRTQYATVQDRYNMGQNQPYSPGLPPQHPQPTPPVSNTYQPPPPPPPPHPPNSPGFYQGQPPSYGSAVPGLTQSYAPSGGRADSHYVLGGEESDISPHGPDDYNRHPLPTPPARDVYDGGYANQQPLPSPPPPAPPSHSDLNNRPLPRLPPPETSDSLFDNVEDALAEMSSAAAGERDSYQSTGTRTNGRLDSVYDYYSNSSDADALRGLEQMREDEEYEQRRQSAQSASANAVGNPPARRDTDESDLGFDISGYGGDIGFYGADFAPSDSLTTGASSLPYYPQQSEYTTRTDSLRTSPLPPVPVEETSDAMYGLPDESTLHPFPAITSSARVDTAGTGGLTEPKPLPERRMSFDEGSEKLDAPYPTNDDESDDDFPELFYYPPESTSTSNLPPLSRPLPSIPYGSGESYIPVLRPAGTLPYPDTDNRTSLPGIYENAESYSQVSLGQSAGMNIPRASSMSHDMRSSAPTVTPVRSKTDGRVKQVSKTSATAGPLPPHGSELDLSVGLAPSDLPTIPLLRKFNPKKLGAQDFKRCTEPWALSSIASWLKDMTTNELDLKEAAIADAVAALFTHNVPTMNMADAETLAAKVVSGFMRDKKLVKEEEWVKFGDGEVSGVIFQITGKGCYSSHVHNENVEMPGRCYSHHCARTLKKISIGHYGNEPVQKEKQDWMKQWKINPSDLGNVNKKEIERQNNLHEIVQTEEEYLEHLYILKAVYRDQLAAAQPSIIKPSKIENFIRDVFGKADPVRKVSEEHLLPHLKFRQREQGPWVVGFSDIFREWIRKAKEAYLEYAAAFPRADMLVRREADRNLLFRDFLDRCRQDPRTRRLDWVTFLKGPITRLQRYSLLLSTVLKHTITESEEKQNLERAIEEIKAVTLECDQRVDEMSKRVQLVELGVKLILRQEGLNLRLDEMGRELIFKGDLQRMGSNRFTWVETTCMLFDHYFIIAKTVQQKGAGGTKNERYDVSRTPIPMELLVLESTDDEPVIRGAANKFGLAAPTTQAKVDLRGRHNTVGSAPQLPGNSSSASLQTIATAPVRLGSSSAENDARLLYPFRIKHLGNPARFAKADDNTYILYAPSAQNRKDWCDKIIYAKEKKAASLHAQNEEPFRLRVLADSAFAVEPSYVAPGQSSRPVKIRGTPLDRAIQDVERRYENDGPQRPSPVAKATVNCATTFVVPGPGGQEMVAIGTDTGVYVCDAENPRGWAARAINAPKVTQISVLEEFSLFLVLADKALIAYHLDSLLQNLPPSSRPALTAPMTPTNPPPKARPPQKLSGAKDVGFFATGRMKDRTLVVFQKRGGMSSNFKVLEPVFQRSAEKRSRFSRKGTTDFFREFDEFYIPAECFGINLFQSSLAVQTSKGFETLMLDKKKSYSIPDLRQEHCGDIAARIKDLRPLGMFRLNDQEFLLCYDECAVYMTKHGDLSRSVIMEFVGKARQVCLYAGYVLVVDNDFVEIRNAQNGRLRQVIAGREVRLLDDGAESGGAGSSHAGQRLSLVGAPTVNGATVNGAGVNGTAPPATAANGAANGVGRTHTRRRTVKVAMLHPNVEGRQLVVELILNPGHVVAGRAD